MYMYITVNFNNQVNDNKYYKQIMQYPMEQIHYSEYVFTYIHLNAIQKAANTLSIKK